MTQADASDVAEWCYEEPWNVYNSDGRIQAIANYWAVVDDDRLVGFYCTGTEARVPGLDAQPDTLDIGVGMRPDLVGVGNGREFAKVVMTHCLQTYPDDILRAVVQSWNERSLRLAASLGFEVAGTHYCVQRGSAVAYTVLLASPRALDSTD
jgi:[ribosomal protein S18]-alanine N-acetyltransferase